MVFKVFMYLKIFIKCVLLYLIQLSELPSEFWSLIYYFFVAIPLLKKRENKYNIINKFLITCTGIFSSALLIVFVCPKTFNSAQLIIFVRFLFRFVPDRQLIS